MSGAILAVDLGTVRIGAAIAESLELPALPLTTLRHIGREADAEAVASLARERRAGVIVVGYPLRLDGSIGPAAQRVDRFVDVLRTRFDGEVVKVDERLTTAAAAKKLTALEGLSGGKQRRIVDRLAAVEILDTYLRAVRRDA